MRHEERRRTRRERPFCGVHGAIAPRGGAHRDQDLVTPRAARRTPSSRGPG
ncbi:hypothetical protein DB32_006089 [Sandaracinus amylolyticus]|uniref:Uncharacterized protein n=1 Tax=Sandaracinus amylolyticus TaxID=927083 RepID=A0A0F6W728_9BACT|nr:hypothetical protein DB32_006089 [Sandaracinus amylolyticus]